MADRLPLPAVPGKPNTLQAFAPTAWVLERPGLSERTARGGSFRVADTLPTPRLLHRTNPIVGTALRQVNNFFVHRTKALPPTPVRKSNMQ
jgi:hypothetical protein